MGQGSQAVRERGVVRAAVEKEELEEEEEGVYSICRGKTNSLSRSADVEKRVNDMKRGQCAVRWKPRRVSRRACIRERMAGKMCESRGRKLAGGEYVGIHKSVAEQGAKLNAMLAEAENFEVF